MAAERLSDTIDLYRFKEINNTYTSMCILIYEGTRVIIKGLASAIDLEDSKSLLLYLTEQGVQEVYYERRKPSGTLYKRWDLRSLRP